MKAILTFSMLLITAFLYGQVPQRMSYHALIKNDVSGIITNQKITLRTAIRQGSPNGETVYMELHETQTSSSGIASVSIGNGDVIQGQFENIDWSKGNYFITSEADIDGDNIFSEVTLRELLSVPYAFYAKTQDSTLSQNPGGATPPFSKPDPQSPGGPIKELRKSSILPLFP